VKADGTILGIDARILADFGAYAYFPANYMARVVGMMIPGAYRLRDYRYAITAVLTNKCPSGRDRSRWAPRHRPPPPRPSHPPRRSRGAPRLSARRTPRDRS